MMFWRQEQDQKRRKAAQEIVVSSPCECVSYGEWATVALLVLSESLLSMDCVKVKEQITCSR